MRAFAATVFAPAIGDEEAGPVAGRSTRRWRRPARVAAPIDVEVATPQGRIHVEALQGAVRRVQTEVASHVGPVVGVTSGFNAMDGD